MKRPVRKPAKRAAKKSRKPTRRARSKQPVKTRAKPRSKPRKPAARRKAAAAAPEPVASEMNAVLDTTITLRDAIRDGDVVSTERLLDKDFQFVDASGHVHTRSEVLAALKASPHGMSDVNVRCYGRVAMVTGLRKSAQGTDLYALDVWIKTPGGWRALIHHNNSLADPDAPRSHPEPKSRPADAPPPACPNPLTFVPYEPKTKAEREIIASFQALETAVTRNDADTWGRYMADEFVVTRTGQHPTTKAERAGHLRAQRAVNAETWVAEVERMKLWVLGDAAVMRADHVMPDNRRPPYRATRVWVKRDGRWQMAVSQQTTRVE
jgi:ketosteroid isomerase-like protein